MSKLIIGFKITVERSEQRIFDDNEFEEYGRSKHIYLTSDRVGVEMASAGSWRKAAKSTYIIGLKELPENDTSPLVHQHIMFAHCYKQQAGWKQVLSRWPTGGGTLLDLEFLTNEKGQRVAAFGYHAGFAGAALSLEVWAHKQLHGQSTQRFPSVKPSPNEPALIAEVTAAVSKGSELSKYLPRVIIIGALGRCGSGAVDCCLKCGIPDANILKWDLAETSHGGPFPQILDTDIFINCIYLSKPGPAFVTLPMLQAKPGRKLNIICDVSCDTTNPHNPIPIYSVNTTFADPTISVEVAGGADMTVISIDHLPTMMPREASEAFSAALIPSLLQLEDRDNAPVWQQAERLFEEKVKTL